MNFVVVLLLVFVVVVKFAFFLDFWNLQASKKYHSFCWAGTFCEIFKKSGEKLKYLIFKVDQKSWFGTKFQLLERKLLKIFYM